jgi:putative membrane protein
MHYWGFGMHLFWWIFWVILIVLFFAVLTPVPRKRANLYRQTPLEILQRRYAAGEITTEEYEERKGRLERDKPLLRNAAQT